MTLPTIRDDQDFTSIESLVGGSTTDLYQFGPNGSLEGEVNGMTGDDLLDYSQVSTDIVVDLGTGVASKVTGGVSNIEHVTGGSGNDLLRGNDLPNQLKGGDANDILVGLGGNDQLDGGAGRDLLIGGISIGGDTLIGGLGEDILIAGWTDHDGNDQALQAILAEWTTDKSFATRRTNLIAGVGPGNAYKLTSSTVHNGADFDKLTGGADSLDWFWAKFIEIMDLDQPAGESAFVGA